MDKRILGKGFRLSQKQSMAGWAFLLPGALLIVWMAFYPMARALILSFQTGVGVKMRFAGLHNYQRMFQDKVFLQTIASTFTYLLIQVPIMLALALVLAVMLNNKKLRFKGLFRTAIFLPCATSLVSYSIIFRSLFAYDGYINTLLINLGILQTNYNWLGNTASAKFVIIIALIWRWTGYNMVFYLAGLQNIEYSIYEAARIDGASSFQQLTRITLPLLKPMILLTAIMSTNGTLQLFDESFNLTGGGPGVTTMTMSHYLYDTAFIKTPNFGYVSALSYVIVIFVAALSLLQLKAGDKRES